MVFIRDRLDKFLCHWWIPVGFFLFFAGLFWSPDSHLFKVTIPYILLLPGLLAALQKPKTLLFILRLPVAGLALIYLVYMALLAVFLNGNLGMEFSKWSFYIMCFILAVGAYIDISERAFTLLLLGCTAVATTAGIYAAFRDITNGAFWQLDYRLIGYGNLYNALRTGFLIGTCSLFAFWCMLNSSLSQWQRYVSALIAVICLAITILTGSRAPLLALAVTGIAVSASEKRWFFLFIVIVVSIAILTVFWDRLSERGLSLRPEIWHYVWYQCLAHPWVGVGLNHHPIAVPTSAGIEYNTHNIFLAVFYQGGVVGLLLFMTLLGTTIYQSWSIRRVTTFGTLTALLQVYAIVALQFDGLPLCTRPEDNWVYLWLPVALHIYARRIAAEKLAPIPAEPRQCAVP